MNLELRRLIKGGDVNGLQKHLKLHPSCLNFECSFTPMHLAAMHGHDLIVVILFYENRDLLNKEDRDCKTPVSYAATNNHLSTVKLLIGFGCNLRDEYRCTWPLTHVAAKHGHNEILEVAHNADNSLIDEFNVNSDSALHVAAIHGHSSTIELLIRLGSRRNVEFEDGSNLHPLHLAVSNGHHGAAETLLRLGAPVDALSQDWETPMEFGYSDARMIELFDSYGSQVIFDAKRGPKMCYASSNHKGAVRTLVRLGFRAFNKKIIKGLFHRKKTLYPRPVANLIALHPDYRVGLRERFYDKSDYDELMIYVNDEEYMLNCRFPAYFAESLVLRLLREDRRLTQQRAETSNKH